MSRRFPLSEIVQLLGMPTRRIEELMSIPGVVSIAVFHPSYKGRYALHIQGGNSGIFVGTDGAIDPPLPEMTPIAEAIKKLLVGWIEEDARARINQENP